MPLSPAGQDRARRLDQDLDRARRAAGNDTNRTAADRQPSSEVDRQDLPNTSGRRVQR